jgi:hypothetical protein
MGAVAKMINVAFPNCTALHVSSTVLLESRLALTNCYIGMQIVHLNRIEVRQLPFGRHFHSPNKCSLLVLLGFETRALTARELPPLAIDPRSSIAEMRLSGNSHS